MVVEAGTIRKGGMVARSHEETVMGTDIPGGFRLRLFSPPTPNQSLVIVMCFCYQDWADVGWSSRLGHTNVLGASTTTASCSIWMEAQTG